MWRGEGVFLLVDGEGERPSGRYKGIDWSSQSEVILEKSGSREYSREKRERKNRESKE